MADLEKYIIKNREEIDCEQPPSFVWKSIEKELPATPSQTSFTWMWKAATISLLLVCSALIYLVSIKENNTRLYSLGDISEEYMVMEKNYQLTIQTLETSLAIDDLKRDDYAWVFEELEHLDKVNEQFRRDLSESRYDARLIDALIDYYEKKLKLLKILELEINRRNNEKNRDLRL